MLPYFYRFGETCKIILDLSKTDFQISEKYENLMFVILS